MANKISVIIDVAVDKANQSLGSFRKSIQDADGAAGKFKAGATGAFDAVKANAGTLAVAAGAALVTFGAKAISAFQETALEAGRMSEALGMPVDDISRLIEIAGDLGVEAGTLETSIGKMNQTAGKSPKAFDDIGAAIARNKDGSMNVNETFLNTVDALNAIPDAGKRAAAAQQIFGRGWKDMAELIGQGSETITSSMKDVSEQQAISPDEVRRAREYKASMENVKDAMSRLSLAVGENLAPSIALAVGWAVKLVEAFDAIADFAGKPMNLPGVDQEDIDGWENLKLVQQAAADGNKEAQEAFRKGGDAVDEYAAKARLAGDDLGTLTDSVDNAATVVEETGEEYRWWAQDMRSESQQTADHLTADWDRITGKISEEQAFLNAKSEFQTLRDAAVKAWEDGEAGVDEYRLAQLEAQAAVAEYIKEVGGIPPEKATEILALIDQNKLDEAERLLEELTKPRTAFVNIVSSGYAGIPSTVASTAPWPGGRDGNISTPYPLASGGIVKATPGGVPALLAEGGHDEAVIPLSGPNAPKMGGGGNTYNITITGLTGPQVADELVSKIKEYERRNGGLPW